MKLNHIGVSGGKDSTALLLWAVHESGYPPESLRVTFCDTKNEHPLTYDYIQMLSQKVHPIETIHPALGFYDLARFKNRFPARKSRFCTQMLKMIPTRDYAYSLVEQGHEVLLHSGVRAAESEDRKHLPGREWSTFFAMHVYRPLLTWGIKEVWAMHAKYGLKPNPLYSFGFERVGCFPCINSKKKEVFLISKHFPERIDRLRDEENSFDTINGKSTFFARKTVPEQFRSKAITTAAGEKIKVCTIDDVVEWSKTEWGGKQLSLDLTANEIDFADDDFMACPASLGACE